jgi:protein-S-isoprenylcysteine O-methyltransferase Ste14
MAENAFLKNAKRHLDLFEQVLLVAFYGWFLIRIWPDSVSSVNWAVHILILSEGLIVLLLIFRRRTDQISTKLRDWAVAFAGTFAVLLVDKGGPPLSAGGGTFLILVGLVIHVGAKLSLLRSFGIVAADRGVKQRGLYAFMRHPMYAGYMLTHIGFLLASPSWWNFGVYIVAWLFFIARIFAEENVLSANSDYQAYMVGVRYRLVPGVF